MSFPRPEKFIAPVTERLTRAAKDALRTGPCELAVVRVTERNGVAVHADEVDVMLPGELREFEAALQARAGCNEVDEYTVERGMISEVDE